MVNALSAFGALFTAVFILLTGNGLLTTLLSTRMAAEGFSTAVTGLVLSGYYIGLLAGYFRCHRLIERVGHIRAFTVFAAGTTAAALLHGLYLSPLFWGFLRFLCGITSFGLFMVIESWLNECTESHYRGRIFSIYMILSYLGIGVGQQLLNIGDIMRPELFTIAGIIFAVCLIPVSATEGVHPQLPQRQKFSFAAIFRKAPLSMLGCMSAGLTNSSFYAMTPVVCTGIGLTMHQLSWVMTVTVFSGLIAQGVVGRLSDRFDRTTVLTAIVIVVALVSGFMFTYGTASFGGMIMGMAALGALIFAVYPISVARAHDIFEGRNTVAVSAGLLFAYSIGSSVSPILASSVMTVLDSPLGLFAFWCLVHVTFAVLALHLKAREKVKIVPVEDQVTFMPMRNTSHVVMALDPRHEPVDADNTTASTPDRHK